MDQTTSAPINVTPQNTQAEQQSNSQASTTTTSSPATVNDWTSGLNDDLKGYVQSKGFKDVGTVVDSYRNFEKLRGVPQERILTLPEKVDDPNWNNIYDRLGKPKEAKDYTLEIPKEHGDEKFAEWAKQTFHKNNLTRAQGEAVAKEWNAHIAGQMAEQKAAHDDFSAKQELALKKEWGAAYEQNNVIADKAVALFGEKSADILKAIGNAVGMAEGMKILHALGTKLGEDSFVSSEGRNNGFGGKMTPAEARTRINALRSDPEFTRRYINGEAGPKEEMQRLHEYLVS